MLFPKNFILYVNQWEGFLLNIILHQDILALMALCAMSPCFSQVFILVTSSPVKLIMPRHLPLPCNLLTYHIMPVQVTRPNSTNRRICIAFNMYDLIHLLCCRLTLPFIAYSWILKNHHPLASHHQLWLTPMPVRT